ncbi:MAG TPA: hypothetical protein VJ436_01355 [Anaerolineales bacterium]|nr:hypothetical protein [Anaerolineales bacterium]
MDMEEDSPNVLDSMPEDGDVDPTEHWARSGTRIKVSHVPPGAINLNVDGRQVAGALQGFGQLWQKTYKVRLSGVGLTPAEIMQAWKENFPKFQPPANRFYPPLDGIKPGEVVFIEGKVPAMRGTPTILPVASGVLVLYVDDESFTIMTPEGFPEAGWNTFSVYEEDGAPVAQVQSMARAADPLYEIYFKFLGSSEWQEKSWVHVLTSLAAHFGIKGQVTITKTLIDPRIQWAYFKNIVKNAGIWTVFYKLAAPVRWITRKGSR